MKTNVVLNSGDRNLFGITIRQNTKQQFLSVTDLQKAYETARWQYAWSERHVNTIMQGQTFRERAFYVLQEANLIKVGIPAFMEMIEKEGVTNTLKGLGVYKTTGRGSDKTVMANPYIWMLLAMEFNPMIYAKVIIWLTDTLIFNRIEAGTEFLPMNAAIKTVVENPDYRKYATEINKRVFGRHETGIRNIATAQELRNIADIEKFVTQSIGMGIISNDSHILKVIDNYKINKHLSHAN